MKFFKVLFGLAAAAALVPYKVNVEKASDEENAPKNVTLNSLLYTLEIKPNRDENGEVAEGKDVSMTIPSPAMKRIVCAVKSKLAECCACSDCDDCDCDCDCEDAPAEEITIEVTADAAEEPAAE